MVCYNLNLYNKNICVTGGVTNKKVLQKKLQELVNIPMIEEE